MQTYFIIGVAALVACIGSYFYGNHTGAKTEAAKWLKRENVELVAANAKIIEVTAKYRAIEQKAAQDMNAVAVKLQKENLNGLASKDRIIADLRSGALKLRVCPASKAAVGNTGASTPASPGSGSTTTGSQLSGTPIENLVALAAEADEIVNQLGACQAILVQDRAVVNR